MYICKPTNILKYIFIFVAIFVVILINLMACGKSFSLIKLYVNNEEKVQTNWKINGNVKVYILEIVDIRGTTSGNAVGNCRTGAINKSTPVIIKGGLNVILRDILISQFKKAGFIVVANQLQADVIFKCRINTFWVQEYVGTFGEYSKAKVELDVIFLNANDDEKLWYDVKGNENKSNSTIWDISGQNEKIINIAMYDTIEQILNDQELLDILDSRFGTSH